MTEAQLKKLGFWIFIIQMAGLVGTSVHFLGPWGFLSLLFVGYAAWDVL